MKQSDPTGKPWKKYARIAVIGILAALLAWRANWFDGMDERVLLVFAPVILMLAAKVISLCNGDDGKMSRAYKARFPRNRGFYRLFCALVMIVPVIVVLENGVHEDILVLPLLRRIAEIAWLALLAVSGVTWILTELIRRDFPWGVFRLIERLFWLALLVAGVFLVSRLLVMLVEAYPVFFTAVLYLVIGAALLAAAGVAWRLFNELILVVLIPNREKRASYKREAERKAYEEMEREREHRREWDAAWLSRDYHGVDQRSFEVEVRKTTDGLYVDKEGNKYKERDF